MRGSAVLRIAVALLLFGAWAAFVPSAGAADTGTITLHSRVCPAGQPTTDIYTDCHDSLPTQLTSYSLDGGPAEAVGADGNLSFTDLTPGSYEIAQEEGVPLDFAHLRVWCSIPEAGTEDVELEVSVNTFTVEAVAGEEVVCDVYTIPENASGLTPTPTGGSTGGTTTLPSTGTGSDGGGSSLALVLIALLGSAGMGILALRRHAA